VGVAWWHVPSGGGRGVVGLRNTRRGGGLGAETRNRAVMARFRACCVKWQWGTVLGGGAVARTRWWWWCLWVRETRDEEGLGCRNPKPSRYGSVWGALCGTTMGDVAWWWRGGTYQAVVFVGSWVRET
jgi:hypothetical protein